MAGGNTEGLFWTFEPPGPKAAGWLESTHPNTFLMGPVGGAKTTTGSRKCFEIARLQHPSTKDGWRKALIMAIRMNYRQMWRSLIPSVQGMYPAGDKGVSWPVFQQDGPAKLEFRVEDPRLGKILMIIQFVSVGDFDLESFIRGNEVTAWWLNEVDELPKGSIGLFNQRVGRWNVKEKPDHLPPVEYSTVFGDLNAPDEDSWFTKNYINKRPKGFELFIQPSGFSPDAENMRILRRIGGDDYYHKLAEQMRADDGEWAVRRFIENKPGFSRHGEPVYEDYNDLVHCPAVKPSADPGRRLIVGLDQGMVPAAAICQLDREDRFLILGEEVMEEGEVEDARNFGRRVARNLLTNFSSHARSGNFVVAPDPAARKRGDDLRQWIQHFALGFKEIIEVCPLWWAPTNSPEIRQGAVREFLRGFAAGEPQLKVSRDCPVIRRGFAGAYRLVRVKLGGGKVKDTPDKTNGADDPADAVQYAAMCARPRATNPPQRREAGAPISSAAGGSSRRPAAAPTVILENPM